jgi:hypothetical protein
MFTITICLFNGFNQMDHIDKNRMRRKETKSILSVNTCREIFQVSNNIQNMKVSFKSIPENETITVKFSLVIKI